MLDVNEIKNGSTFVYEGQLYQVVEFLHVKPGKGAAFMKTKLRNLRSGNVVEKTFNTNIKFEDARIERQRVQYLYNTGDVYYFMNTQTYEQLELSDTQVGDNKDYLLDNMEVDIAMFNGELLGLTLPEKIEFTIASCEPSVKGNTATSAQKNAYTETGLLVRVPLFIETGDKIIVSTKDGSYVSRA